MLYQQPVYPSAVPPTDVGNADVRHHLHSQTDLKLHQAQGPLVMVGGDGAYVIDEHGNRYLEGMSGLWCASLGFSNKRLVQAATTQMHKLPYYHTFNHRTTDIASILAAKVANVSPIPNAHVFFSSYGSEANDSMIKMAWNYHVARGESQRRKILARERGYHGSTVMGSSLSGLSNMHLAFGLPLQEVVRVDCPYSYRYSLEGESEAAFVKRLVQNLESTIANEGAETIAAFIAEPIMGAGGVIVPPTGYFEQVHNVLQRHGILMLADEVICGFGRTGNWFGSQTFNIQADMMSCAKGLSSGYAPISCVVVSAQVFEVLQNMSSRMGGFGHGFTYSGHPLSAAVTVEALSIYEEMDLPSRATQLGELLHQELGSLSEHPLVGDIRGVGFIAGIELVQDKKKRTPFSPEKGVGAQIELAARKRGLIVRSLSDVVALCPPFIMEDAQVADMVARLRSAFNDVLAT